MDNISVVAFRLNPQSVKAREGRDKAEKRLNTLPGSLDNSYTSVDNNLNSDSGVILSTQSLYLHVSAVAYWPSFHFIRTYYMSYITVLCIAGEDMADKIARCVNMVDIFSWRRLVWWTIYPGQIQRW